MTWWLIYAFVYLPIRLAVGAVYYSLLALVWTVTFLVHLVRPAEGSTDSQTR